MDRAAFAERDALEKARRLHAENIVIDTLAPGFTAEMLLTPAMVELLRDLKTQGKRRFAYREALAEYTSTGVNQDPALREAYLAFWRRSGVTSASCTLTYDSPPSRAWDETLAEIARSNRLIEGLAGAMVLARSAADIERAHREGRHAVIYNIQNAAPFSDQLDRVDVLHGLGLRIVQITYNLRNLYGDGCLERCDGGLSRFGEALVERLNRRRVMIDLSHCSDRTTLDTVAASRVPVALSHSSARAVSRRPRSKPDDLLREVANKGGYIGVVVVPNHLTPPEGDSHVADHPGLPAGWATLDTVVDHVVHMIDLVGVDAVGIGTDYGKPYYHASVIEWTMDMVREEYHGFDWVGWRPSDQFLPNQQMLDLETWDKWPNLTAAMLRRGIPERTVVKVVGGNFLRFFREICG